MKRQLVGSNFDDFLREENLLDVAEATAVKRVTAFQIAQEMKRPKGDQVRDVESDED
jgi:antitoxin HicB